MLEYISLGPLAFPTYPILTLVGLWLGTSLATRVGQRFGLSIDDTYNIALLALLAALVGGRAWYVTTHWSAYARQIWQAVVPTLNALAWPGAALAAIIAVYIYCRRKQLSLPSAADVLAPGITLMLLVSSVGAFLGSRRLGLPSDLPWAVPQIDELRHPVFLYQAALFALLLLWTWREQFQSRWPGFAFLRLGAWYAAVWLITEPFFAWSDVTDEGLRLTQLVALGALVLALALMAWGDHHHRTDQTEPPAQVSSSTSALHSE